jgi:hypothetical protein
MPRLWQMGQTDNLPLGPTKAGMLPGNAVQVKENSQFAAYIMQEEIGSSSWLIR